MENLGLNAEFWRGKSVLITGHTGFKGGWLSLWLSKLGSNVHGFALSPQHTPNLFSVAKIQKYISSSKISDINDLSALQDQVNEVRPEIIFHMAAQPLVRESYLNPLETYKTNMVGTINLFEAVRDLDNKVTIVNVTTDKCYQNNEWVWPYRESDRLGGDDPYSCSKACVELITHSYRKSFFKGRDISVSTARAGNVIGGGDWSTNRLLPDLLRSLETIEPVKIRSPGAVRPWQHVLEPLAGYLRLAELMHRFPENYSDAWNFGPDQVDAKPVSWIVDYITQSLPSIEWQFDDGPHPKESKLLVLDNSKVKSELNWYPRLNIKSALKETIEWHVAWKKNQQMDKVCFQQIDRYAGNDNV